jgi:hypothetical protein
MLERDLVHPIDLGHKTIADVVVYALQQSALQVAMFPYGASDLELLTEPLPPPMFPGNYEGKNRLCVYGEVRAVCGLHHVKDDFNDSHMSTASGLAAYAVCTHGYHSAYVVLLFSPCCCAIIFVLLMKP